MAELHSTLLAAQSDDAKPIDPVVRRLKFALAQWIHLFVYSVNMAAYFAWYYALVGQGGRVGISAYLPAARERGHLWIYALVTSSLSLILMTAFSWVRWRFAGEGLTTTEPLDLVASSERAPESTDTGDKAGEETVLARRLVSLLWIDKSTYIIGYTAASLNLSVISTAAIRELPDQGESLDSWFGVAFSVVFAAALTTFLRWRVLVVSARLCSQSAGQQQTTLATQKVNTCLNFRQNSWTFWEECYVYAMAWIVALNVSNAIQCTAVFFGGSGISVGGAFAYLFIAPSFVAALMLVFEWCGADESGEDYASALWNVAKVSLYTIGSFAFLNFSDVIFQRSCPEATVSQLLVFALITTVSGTFIIIQLQLFTARREKKGGGNLLIGYVRKASVISQMGCGLAVSYAWTYCIFGLIESRTSDQVRPVGLYINAVAFTLAASCSVVASTRSVWLEENSSLVARSSIIGNNAGQVVISAAFGGGEDPSLP